MKTWEIPGNLWRKPGNYTCNHIPCEKEADFIVGSTHRDYSHFCKEHVDEYDNEGMEIIPIIRSIIAKIEQPKSYTARADSVESEKNTKE